MSHEEGYLGKPEGPTVKSAKFVNAGDQNPKFIPKTKYFNADNMHQGLTYQYDSSNRQDGYLSRLEMERSVDKIGSHRQSVNGGTQRSIIKKRPSFISAEKLAQLTFQIGENKKMFRKQRVEQDLKDYTMKSGNLIKQINGLRELNNSNAAQHYSTVTDKTGDQFFDYRIKTDRYTSKSKYLIYKDNPAHLIKNSEILQKIAKKAPFKPKNSFLNKEGSPLANFHREPSESKRTVFKSKSFVNVSMQPGFSTSNSLLLPTKGNRLDTQESDCCVINKKLTIGMPLPTDTSDSMGFPTGRMMTEDCSTSRLGLSNSPLRVVQSGNLGKQFTSAITLFRCEDKSVSISRDQSPPFQIPGKGRSGLFNKFSYDGNESIDRSVKTGQSF